MQHPHPSTGPDGAEGGLGQMGQKEGLGQMGQKLRLKEGSGQMEGLE
jgi:hypothetical protein